MGPRAAGPRTSGPKGYLALGLLVLLGDITSGKLGGCLERQLDALSLTGIYKAILEASKNGLEEQKSFSWAHKILFKNK